MYRSILMVFCCSFFLSAVEPPFPPLPDTVVVADTATVEAAVARLLATPAVRTLRGLDAAIAQQAPAFEKRFGCTVERVRIPLLQALMSSAVSLHLAKSGAPHVLLYMNQEAVCLHTSCVEDLDDLDGWSDRFRAFYETVPEPEDAMVWMDSHNDIFDEWLSHMVNSVDSKLEYAYRLAIVENGQVIVCAAEDLLPLMREEVCVGIYPRSALDTIIPEAFYENESIEDVIMDLCKRINAELVVPRQGADGLRIGLRTTHRPVTELLDAVLIPVGWEWQVNRWSYYPIIVEGKNPVPAVDGFRFGYYHGLMPERSFQPHRVSLVSCASLFLPTIKGGEHIDALRRAILTPEASVIGDDPDGTLRGARDMIRELSAQMRGSWRPMITVRRPQAD